MKLYPIQRAIQQLLGWRRLQNAIRETESTLRLGSSEYTSAQAAVRERYTYDRQEVQQQALEAWRTNPLARRIVGLATEYVIGSGMNISCKHATTDRFIRTFWHHPLNRLDVKLYEWCDELSRTGNLFLLVATDAAGMSYVRAVPSDLIGRIVSAEHDVEQELCFYPKASLADPQPAPWPAYRPAGEEGLGEVMLHYAINKPVGAQWGESDLAPVLKWLARYANWLEDRARLNRYRNAFLYVVQARFTSEADRLNRQQVLNANPPAPGSILVTDENETWAVINPTLQASDAQNDGLALKKMIAAGAGVPMHFLAEPESSTRTTAEAAGGPTFRYFEQRQKFFVWVVKDLLKVAIRRRCMLSGPQHAPDPEAELIVSGADISARDNMSLAMAANNLMNTLIELRERQVIDDAEMLRLVYRFAGEQVDVEEMLRRGRESDPAPRSAAGQPARRRSTGTSQVNIDAVRGEVTPKGDPQNR